MATFEVSGTIKFDINLEVEADSPEDAEKKAKSILADMYSLDGYGAYHKPEYVEYKIYSSH